MPPKDIKIVKKILQRINAVIGYCQGIDYLGFSENTMLNEACVFNLLQIGEMCHQDLSDSFKKSHGSVPWHQIYGLRNRIVHGYDDIKMNIIWETISDDLPKLKKDLEGILLII